MKKLLLGLVIFSHIGSAQNTNKPLGYYIDLNGTELTDFVDLDYDGHIFHKVRYNVTAEYVKGYYVDREGKKHEGFINGPNWYGNSYSHFFYKERIIGSRPKRIRATKVKYFKTELDSFFVQSKVLIYKKMGSVTYDNRFLGLVMENDEMSVFEFKFLGVPSYILSLKGSDKMIAIPKKEEEFKVVIKRIFNSSSNIMSQIENGDLESDDFLTLVKTYGMELKYKSASKVWYDDNWVECDQDEATGYMKIIDQTDSVFTAEYYSLKTNNIVLRGQYSSFFPIRREGKFEWYYPNAEIRKAGQFGDNKPLGVFVEYYENGSVHREFEHVNGNNRRYNQVYSPTGEELLVEGSGIELFEDTSRSNSTMVTRRYENRRLSEAYYDLEGNRVYQFCQTKPFVKGSLKRSLVSFNYDISDASLGIEGNVLVRVLIGTDGKISEYEILRGVSLALDGRVAQYLNTRKTNSPIYKPARIGKEKVNYETILTFSFGIGGSSEARNYYYDWTFQNQMHFQMMMNQPLNLPNIPSPPPSFH